MIQQKKSQVLFVLTGDCGNQTISEGISVYELIAAASTGQVFQLKKKDVNQMLKFVEESVQANRVNLISTDNGEAANKTYIVPVDNALEELTIALSGKDSVLEIYHPNGNIVQYHKMFIPLRWREVGNSKWVGGSKSQEIREVKDKRLYS